jgi:hypothetical protein
MEIEWINRMILIIQIMVPDIFIKSELIELFEKIVCLSRLSISIGILFILFLIIGIIPGIGNRHTNWFNTYKYLD